MPLTKAGKPVGQRQKRSSCANYLGVPGVENTIDEKRIGHMKMFPGQWVQGGGEIVSV